MQYVTENSSLIDLYISYENKKIANICNTNFLGITLDNTLTWKIHIDTRVKIEFSMVCD